MSNGYPGVRLRRTMDRNMSASMVPCVRDLGLVFRMLRHMGRFVGMFMAFRRGRSHDADDVFRWTVPMCRVRVGRVRSDMHPMGRRYSLMSTKVVGPKPSANTLVCLDLRPVPSMRSDNYGIAFVYKRQAPKR